MKKYLQFILLILTIVNEAQAQVEFQKKIEGANMYEARQLPDSGFAAFGTYSFSGHGYLCLIKLNQNGDTTWSKLFRQSNSDDGKSFDLTADGGYILCGSTFDQDSTYSSNVYLIKTNSEGDTLWTKMYFEDGHSYGLCVRQTLDKGYIISGSSASELPNDSINMYLIKTDSIGNLEWSKIFDGIHGDNFLKVCLTSDSGFVALGNAGAHMGIGNIVLVKLNSNGDTLWTRGYGGSGIDISYDIKETKNHGLIVVGETSPISCLSQNILFFLTDSVGNLVWAKQYGEGNTERGLSVFQTEDLGFIISGQTYSLNPDALPYVIKLNDSGDIQWSKVYNQNSFGMTYCITQTFDKGYFVSGEYNELMKLDSLGNSGCFDEDFPTTIAPDTTVAFHIPISLFPTNTIMQQTITQVSSGIWIENICTSDTSSLQAENIKTKNTITIYPNPFIEDFQLSITGAETDAEVSIYNIIGQQQEHLTISHNKSIHQTFSLRNYSSGVYLVSIKVNGENFMKKIIKQ